VADIKSERPADIVEIRTVGIGGTSLDRRRTVA
jgi:hypothetical protein